MKKILSLLLCLTLVLSIAAMAGSADEPAADADRIAAASKWDGVPLTVTSDAELYTFEGEGTEVSPWLIQSASDLAKLSANVRYESFSTNYAGKYFKLTCDVDFQNHGWYGIGGVVTDTNDMWRSNKNRFEGVFDGDHHVVYNFNLASDIEGAPVYVNGLFGHAGDGAVIKNIGIASGSVTLGSTDRVGMLLGVARMSLTIENCFNKADVNITVASDCPRTEFRVGGLVGAVMNDGSAKHIFKDCYNTGDMTITVNDDSNISVGGLIGYLSDGNNAIDNCYNTGDIALTSTVRTTHPWLNQAQGVYRDYDNAMGSLIGTFAFAGNISISNCGADGTLTYTNTATETKTLNIGKLMGFTASQITFTNITDSVTVGTTTGIESTYTNTIVCLGQNTQPATTVVDTLTLPLEEGELYFLNAKEVAEVPGDNETPGGDNGNTENNGTNNGGNDETSAPETNAPETNAPETNAPETNAPETNAPANEEKSGCGSVVGIGAVAVLAIVGAACTMRKKED